MKIIKVGSLFSGIGGFDLGFERAGMTIAWQVEINEYCRQVLAKHWPNVPKFGDIRECGAHNLTTVDLVCGGFPCQPFSLAGKQKGKNDDRYLWPEMLRIVSEIRPRWVVGENVSGIINMELDNLLFDLESAGYESEAIIIPACAVDAKHRRDRIWIMAHDAKSEIWRRFQKNEKRKQNSSDRFGNSRQVLANSTCSGARTEKQQRQCGIAILHGEDISNSDNAGCKKQWGTITTASEDETTECGNRWESEPDVGRVAYGIPHRVDRLTALGNAIVPQIPEIIGRMILSLEDQYGDCHAG